MSIINNPDDVAKILKDLSLNDFLTVGLNQVAYIKQIINPDEEKESFVVHAADGSQLSIMDSYDLALATVKINDLHAVTVH